MDVTSRVRGRLETWFLSRYAFVGISRRADGGAEVQWIKASGGEFCDPFFKTSVDRISQRVQAGALVRTEEDALLRVGRANGRPYPSGFIFHVGRCGSTLLANMLRADKRNFVLSEPFLPINMMLHAPQEFEDPMWLEMTRASIMALGRVAPKRARHYFIKLFNGSVLQAPFVREAVPGVPEVFLYRDPIEVVVSLLADQSPLPWLWFQSMTGLRKEAVAECPLVELVARVIGRLLSAMAEYYRAGTLLLNYSEVGLGTPALLMSHFCCEGDARVADRMVSCLGASAKEPRAEFVSDVARKRASATKSVQEAVARYAAGPYERLESLRRHVTNELRLGPTVA